MFLFSNDARCSHTCAPVGLIGQLQGQTFTSQQKWFVIGRGAHTSACNLIARVLKTACFKRFILQEIKKEIKIL